jgi:Holliday junction resolvase RusA-like endonuclease
MTYVYTIEGRISGANELISAINKHRYAGSKLKAQETKRCALWAMSGSVPKFTKPVKVHFMWFEPNKRRDLDNIRYGAKFILDGLREAGKIPNDGWAWVVGMSDEWFVDKAYPRVEVTITELE